MAEWLWGALIGFGVAALILLAIAATALGTWLGWLIRDPISRNLARTVGLAIGVGTVVTGLVRANHQQSAAAAIVAGTILIGAVILIPWIDWLKVGDKQVSIRAPRADPFRATRDLTAEITDPARSHPLDPMSIDADDDFDADVEDIAYARFLVADRALQGILSPDSGDPLEKGELRLFLFDHSDGTLYPVWRPESATSEPHRWKSGEGVVGHAWAQQRWTYAAGEAAHDATLGLSDALQARFADLRGVAATPVKNGADRPIGILAVSTKEEDVDLGTEDAVEALEVRASETARVLVDLLRWFEDSA